MNTFCVYMHTNKINGKKYIGQTCKNPEYRWNKGKGYTESTYFYNAIQKYGWDNFKHEILYENLTLEEANNIEESLINKFNTTNPKNGYNLKSGGENNFLTQRVKDKISKANKGRKLTDEHKRKISETNKGRKRKDITGENNPMFGKHHTEEVKQKISKANKGRFIGENHYLYGKHLPEDTKQKIGIANKGKLAGDKNPMYGKHHSEETKKKISEINKGRLVGKKSPMYGKHLSNEVKQKISEANKGKGAIPVYCVELDVLFDSIVHCAKKLKLDKSAISAVCRGKRKTTGGYHFKYIGE